MGRLLEFYSKDEWRNNVNLDVIRFIDEVNYFPDLDGEAGGQIDHLFSAGYCYYFATMLKTAFGGRICWVQDLGHIVWADCDENCTFEELQNNVVYDITGVFMDYERLWPIEYLGDALINFLHNGKSLHIGQTFKDWCDHLGVTEIYALSTVWSSMPMDDIMHDYFEGRDLVETAYAEWMRNSDQYQELIRLLKNPEAYMSFHHLGVCEEIKAVQREIGEAETLSASDSNIFN